MDEKYCRLCKIFKPKSEFHKDWTTKDGYRFYCKPCIKVINKDTYQRKKDNYRKVRFIDKIKFNVCEYPDVEPDNILDF